MKTLILFLLISFSGISQTFTDTVKFDCMEAFDWSGNWYFQEPTTGFFTNASKSAPTSAVIYGTGGGADEYDWYSLPNVTGLDPFKEYKIQINLGAYRFTSTGSTSGVDAADYIEVQISTDGGANYSSELRVTGFNNAYWDYNSATASVTADGTVDIFTPTAGGNRTSTGDGYSILEIIIPGGASQIAVDILSVVDRAGEEWWIDDIYLLKSVNTPLAVELLDFTATAHPHCTDIEWSTASENNSSHFDLEKSINGFDWNRIAVVQSSGFSSMKIDYSHRDLELINGDSYYRLKEIDFNGTIEIFETIHIRRDIINEENYYDLMGRPVKESYKGLVISNKGKLHFNN